MDPQKDDWREITEDDEIWLKNFKRSDSSRRIKCMLCPNKKVPFTSFNKYVLKRHYVSFHPEHGKEFNVQIKRRRNESDQEPTVSKKVKSNVLTKGEYIKNCVVLAVVHMTSFAIFNAAPFQELTSIHSTNAQLLINSANIGIFIALTAKYIRRLIKEELGRKIFSVKLDIATRHRRSMLGVNIQFYCSLRQKIVIHTLGFIELASHTSKYLQQEVYKLLDSYEINRRNIYCFISDNGANMFRLGSTSLLMQHDLNLTHEMRQEDSADESDGDEETEFNFDFDENSTQIDEAFRNEQDFYGDGTMEIPVVVRCAAQTLQLVVHDALKMIGKDNIQSIRKVIMELRSSECFDYMNSTLKALKFHFVTRWNSLHLMFLSILKNKLHFEEMYRRIPESLKKHIFLNVAQFKFMEQFTEAFAPIIQFSNELQAEQLAMSDMLVSWFRCKKTLSSLNVTENTLQKPLVESFDKQSDQLMENPVLAAAVYIDPRLHHNKSTAHLLGVVKPMVEARLLKVYRRIKEIKRTPSANLLKLETQSSFFETDDLDDYFEAEMSRIVASSSESAETDSVLIEEIRKLGSQDKIPMSSNILKYYAELHRNNKINEDLFELAMVVLSAPANQISVERSFSAISSIHQQRRRNMTGANIDDVLICKVNQELLTFVPFERMNIEEMNLAEIEQVYVKEEKM